MILECEMCAKRISRHSGSHLCRSCQKELTEKKGREAAGIPTEDAYVSRQISSSDWSKMGYWASTGKGKTYIDNSPGAGFGQASLVVGFAGLLSLFVAPFIVAVLVFSVALIPQVLKNRARQRYLRREYKEKYSYLETK